MTSAPRARRRRRDLRAPPPEAQARRAQAAPAPRGRLRARRGLRSPLRRRRRGRHGCRHLRVVVRPQLAAAGRDRLEHLHLRRRQLAPRRDPGGAEPPAGGARQDQPLDAEGDGRDRGPALLRAQRRRRRGHRPRALEERQRRAGRRGRLDDHAAARAQPLHRPRAHGRAEAEGGVSRDQAGQRLGQEPDPGHVHEPGLLRQPGVRDRGGGADVLLEARQRAQPPGSRR